MTSTQTSSINLQKPSKGLHISLWIAQGLLAAMFLMVGAMKLTQPIDQIATSMPWVLEAPAGLVRFVGLCELLGGVGLILPSLLRIKPKLTAYAAIGIATIMLFAIVFHIAKGEASVIGMNIVIGLIAAFIAWGRLKKAPVQPKS